jgi:hypothetical protein
MKQRYAEVPFLAAAAVLVTLGLIFRFNLVAAWHVPGGDGLQYYALSQELARAGRFSFAPPPEPLSFARMPGYPLFLAYVAVRAAPLSLVDHLIRATRWNVIIDLATGLMVMALLRQWLGRIAALAGLAFVFVYPLLCLVCCYGLTETLATFLSTAMLFCVLHATRAPTRRRMFVWTALAGVVTGCAHLVRTDSLTFLPAIALALWWAPVPLRQRVSALGLFGACAAVVFAPWPIRNQLRFGEPHFAAYYWRTNSGKTLPMGPVHWARTWSTGAIGQSYLDLAFALEAPLEPKRPGILLPVMYDDDAEKQRVAALFDRYNRERLSHGVNAEFEALAKERARRAPLRTYFGRPLLRMYHLWKPVPEWELPMRVPWLHLPERRDDFGNWCTFLYVTALLGAGVLLRRRETRRLGMVLAVPVVCRSLLYSYVVALGATERYVVEVIPILICSAVFGMSAVVIAAKRGVMMLRRRAATA